MDGGAAVAASMQTTPPVGCRSSRWGMRCPGGRGRAGRARVKALGVGRDGDASEIRGPTTRERCAFLPAQRAGYRRPLPDGMPSSSRLPPLPPGTNLPSFWIIVSPLQSCPRLLLTPHPARRGGDSPSAPRKLTEAAWGWCGYEVPSHAHARQRHRAGRDGHRHSSGRDGGRQRWRRPRRPAGRDVGSHLRAAAAVVVAPAAAAVAFGPPPPFPNTRGQGGGGEGGKRGNTVAEVARWRARAPGTWGRATIPHPRPPSGIARRGGRGGRGAQMAVTDGGRGHVAGLGFSCFFFSCARGSHAAGAPPTAPAGSSGHGKKREGAAQRG